MALLDKILPQKSLPQQAVTQASSASPTLQSPTQAQTNNIISGQAAENIAANELQLVESLQVEETELSLRSDKIVFWGSMIVLSAFGTFLGWAIFAPLKEAVVAQGTVVLESNRKTVQHLEGGIVGKINVRDGDLVDKGDILIELDPTQTEANYDLVVTRYWSELAALDRLNAEIAGLKRVQYSDELLQKSTTDIVKFIKDQDNLFFARREQQLGQVNLLQKKKEQLAEQIQGLGAQSNAMREQINLTNDELSRMMILHKENLVDGVEIISRKREVARLKGELGRISAQIAELKVAISEADQEISQVRRENQRALSEEIATAQKTFFETREQLVANQDRLNRTNIRAPISGTVFGLAVHTEGGVVPPGEALMEIIPGDDLLVVETKIQLQDVDNVFPGKPVRLRFSAFKSRLIPELQGVVRSISGDALLERETGLNYYKAILVVYEEELRKLDANKIIPGMLVDVSIEGNERTAMNYLLDPLTEVVEKSLVEE